MMTHGQDGAAKRVRAVSRASALFRVLRDGGGTARLSALAQALDVPRSSLNDLIRPLIHAGWLQRRADGRLTFGSAIAETARGALGIPPLPDLDANLARVAEAAEGLAYLSALDAGETRVMSLAQAQAIPGVRLRVGDAWPTNWTLAGRMLASDLTGRQLDYFLAAHGRRVPGRSPRSAEETAQQISCLRGQTIATALGEPAHHVTSVACAIRVAERTRAVLVAVCPPDRETAARQALLDAQARFGRD